MKRLVMTVAVALCLGAAAHAAGNQPANGKWNANINVEQLGRYLNLDNRQYAEVANICTYFNDQMVQANHSNAKRRKEEVRKAVYANLKLMKQTLDKKQYANYTRILNLTLRNRGVVVE